MTTIQIAGGNLFAIAATKLGNATQWIRIAQLNGMSDPFISGVVTLKIPDADPNYTGGGVAPQ